MEIWSPHERVGKPLIGSNHMHSIVARREADETSMLVERHIPRANEALERRDVMAFVSE